MNRKELIKGIATSFYDGTWNPKVKGDGIWLERKLDSRTEQISFTTIKSSDGFKFVGVASASVSFDAIEDILTPLFKEYNFKYLHRTIHFQSTRKEEIYDLEIKEQEDIDEIVNWLTFTFENELSDFFLNYSNLNSVNNQLQTLEKEHVSSFIYAPPVLKIVTIKGILETLDFREYLKWAIDVYAGMSNGKTEGFEFGSYQILLKLQETFASN